MERISAAPRTPPNWSPGSAPRWPHAVGGPARRAAAVTCLLIGAWLLAALPLLWASALVAAGAAALLLTRYPWLIWPGLAVALPFASAVQIGPASAADGLLAAAVFVWFAEGARRNRLRLNGGVLPGLFLIYLLALLLSFPNAINLQKALAGVLKWAQMLTVILLIQEALTPRQTRWLVWGLLAGGALQAAVGVYQFVFRIGPPSFLLLDRFMRASGTFGQPNPFAGYLGLTLPVAIALCLHAFSSCARRTGAARARPLAGAAMYAAVAGIIGLGLLASWSRGGWLAAGTSAAVILLIHCGRKAAGVALGGVGALFLVGAPFARFIPASLTDRLADLRVYLGVDMWEVVQQPITNSNFSVIERLAHWIAALRMWELSPWLGVGPGNYAAIYPQVRLPRWEDPLGHAHNIYLNVLAENGLIGILAYLALWAGVVGWLVRMRRRPLRGSGPSAEWNAALILGVLGVVVHLSVHHLFDSLYVQGIYLHVGLWLGAAVALARNEPAANRAIAGRPPLRQRADAAFAPETEAGRSSMQARSQISSVAPIGKNMDSILRRAKALPRESLKRKETKRFVKFAIVGALGSVTDFTILNALVHLTGFAPVVANGFSFSAAVAQNFLLNRWWTFPESRIRNTRRQMAKFALVSVVGLGINTVIFQFVDLSLRSYWIEWLSSPDQGATISINFAKLFSIGVVLFWNFAANRLWTYKGL